MWICVKDMNKWMDATKRNPSNHLVQLLSRPPLVDTVLHQIGIRAFPEGHRLLCLSFVILDRIISVSMPSTLAKSIIQAFDEAFEMIYYIDDKINVGNYEDKRKHQLAKILWEYKGVHLSKKDSSSTSSNMVAASEAISLINNERRQQFHDGLVAREMDIIINLILMGEMEYRSMEELYFHSEQLFVDMLLFFLSQLPIAILKEVNESPIEAHEERSRFVLKLLCKLELLEDKVRWSFPEGYRVTRLMDPEAVEGINDDTENPILIPTPVEDQQVLDTTIEEV
ncbi:hypothetical protein Scep_010757 [Stephania cephalantha]|uniref:Uncharacterized protein n=1 Tax=Stephania cephalantha TaxID=152367 RepID=A0AAP0JVZ6_9MAGN